MGNAIRHQTKKLKNYYAKYKKWRRVTILLSQNSPPSQIVNKQTFFLFHNYLVIYTCNSKLKFCVFVIFRTSFLTFITNFPSHSC